MSKGVLDIQISRFTLAEANKLPIPEMLLFIKNLEHSMNPHEFEIAGPIIRELELILLYLNKIGLRMLPLMASQGALPAIFLESPGIGQIPVEASYPM
ncbi:hypothetical protein [Paenibacillus herberti]|uniref:Uncharacterized protein n=1 Tax=Paenibacillus herberti TaxID=1619309 RepID=A0A229P269_9BACL|nr:hypothetical protein [Paenibacillus herberti]OXM16363.1 hypothetical protein CGZ75_06680 [Paenibacillus herberti]